MSRINGEAELLEGDGAQQGPTSERASEEHGWMLFTAKRDPNLTHAPYVALAVRELDRPLVWGRELQVGDELGRERGVDRASIDEEIRGCGSFAILGILQRRMDSERAHG